MAKLLLLLALPLAAQAAERPGCFTYNFTGVTPGLAGYFYYTNPILTLQGVTTPRQCQNECVKDKQCEFFTFTQGLNECAFSGNNSKLTLKYDPLVAKISGPRECWRMQDLEMCTSTPASGFPGATPEASGKAWPNGYQPRKLACWPRDPFTTWAGCPGHMQYIAIGMCDYTAFPPFMVPAGKTCKQMCEENPMCATYNQPTPGGLCYNGIGFSCKPANASSPVTGERIIRGSSRTIMSLRSKRFVPDAVAAARWENVNKLTPGLSMVQEAELCQQICQSYLACTYYELSNTTGCWMETASDSAEIAYPLLSSNLVAGPGFVTGGYVQKLCPDYIYTGEVTSTPATVKVKQASLPVWVIPAAVGAGLLLLFVGVYCFCCTTKSKKSSKKVREVATVSAAEQVPLMPAAPLAGENVVSVHYYPPQYVGPAAPVQTVQYAAPVVSQSYASPVSSVLVPPGSGYQTATVVSQYDAQGRPIQMYTGADRNADGIPDALQQ